MENRQQQMLEVLMKYPLRYFSDKSIMIWKMTFYIIQQVSTGRTHPKTGREFWQLTCPIVPPRVQNAGNRRRNCSCLTSN